MSSLFGMCTDFKSFYF